MWLWGVGEMKLGKKIWIRLEMAKKKKKPSSQKTGEAVPGWCLWGPACVFDVGCGSAMHLKCTQLTVKPQRCHLISSWATVTKWSKHWTRYDCKCQQLYHWFIHLLNHSSVTAMAWSLSQLSLGKRQSTPWPTSILTPGWHRGKEKKNPLFYSHLVPVYHHQLAQQAVFGQWEESPERTWEASTGLTCRLVQGCQPAWKLSSVFAVCADRWILNERMTGRTVWNWITRF